MTALIVEKFEQAFSSEIQKICNYEHFYTV